MYAGAGDGAGYYQKTEMLTLPSAVGRGRGRGVTRAPASLSSDSVSSISKVCKTVDEMHLDGKSVTSDQASSIEGSAVALSLFTTRPAHMTNKQGTSGRVTTFRSNFIPIDLIQSGNVSDWQMYQYHVSFTPVMDSKEFRIQMVKKFVEYFGEEPVFDGAIFYSPELLPQDTFDLEGIHPKSGETIRMHVKLTNTINVDDQQCLTIFNLINRKAFGSLGYSQIGRHFFDSKHAMMVKQHNLEIWPGVVASIRMYEEKLLMCCETSHKVLRTDTAYDMLQMLYRKNGADGFRDAVNNEIVGCSVLTRYNNKTYRIDDILWNKTPKDTFSKADGTEISYEKYYEIQYNEKVIHGDQPLLVSRSKKHGGLGSLASQPDIHLIPEFCTMTGLTKDIRNNRTIMKELANHTRVAPEARAGNARNYLRDIKSNVTVNAQFKKWNLDLGSDILSLQGRVLPGETIFLKTKSVFGKTDWASDCRSNQLVDMVPLDRWAMVFYDEEKAAAETLFMEMRNQCRVMRWTIETPTIIKLDRNDIRSYIDGVEQSLKQCPEARIIVVVVGSNDSSRYSALKKQCCTETKAVPSQVVRAVTLSKNLPSVCSKIMLQMNCKMGGSIWRVDIPLKNSMVLGYDCYHDSANKSKTVGAAVSSFDKDMTRWFSSCALHEDGKEMCKNLVSFVRDALKKYRDNNNNVDPDNLILYRDGVGEGQIAVVYREEVPRVKKALAEMGASSTKLAFIIVTKRVTLRFFEEKNGKLINPSPGSLIDSALTRRERYDFYMVPQSVREGTVSPVSYNVICDDTRLSPDQMQRLSYKMCHMYFNWQGTIRVPAPCQYAHKLATLVAGSLHVPASRVLADKLFYL